MRLSIPSDAGRIHQALIQPEYLETWITLPGDTADSRLVAWREGGSYRFDHYRNGRLDLTISGNDRVRRRRKMLFTWKKNADRIAAESLVSIRLCGNFSSTILELHHTGIVSKQECEWQRQMWCRSLDRLCQLFGC